jgi:hypothetical protein
MLYRLAAQKMAMGFTGEPVRGVRMVAIRPDAATAGGRVLSVDVMAAVKM